MKIKSLKYTVEITIAENWISDGFTLTEENLQNAILSQLLAYARENEVKVKILSQPEKETVAAVRGDNKFFVPGVHKVFRVRKPIQATTTSWR